MSDTRSVLERELRRVGPPRFDLGDVARRRNRKQRNRRLGTVALAFVLAAVSVAGLVRAFNLAGAPEPGDGTQPVVAIPIELGADFVAVGEGGVWVSGEGGISRLDPDTNEVIATFPGDGPDYTGRSIAVGEGAVWAFQGRGPGGEATSIVRLDPATNEVAATITPDVEPALDGGEAGAGLWGITTGLGSVWAGAHHGGALLRIDPTTNEVEVIPMPRPAAHVGAVLDGRVWLVATNRRVEAAAGCGALTAVDPASNGILVYDEPMLVCYQLEAGFGSLWMSVSGGSVIRFDPSTERRLATIDLPQAPDGNNAMVMAVGDDAVWVGFTTREEELVVFRIDPETNEVVGELRLQTPAGGIAAGGGAVWVTDGLGTLYRIDPDAVS
jgi:streptogramin lyase